MKLKEADIIRLINQDSIWSIGNNWLYELFTRYPNNQKDEEIVAKVWLLGRAYSAAIERRIKKDEISNNDFYKKRVVKAIKDCELDAHLEKLREEQNSDTESLLKVHRILQNELEGRTNWKKRSFTSKYLHFHLPNKYFIYDSRAVKALSTLPMEYRIQRITKEALGFNEEDVDLDYTKFFVRCEYAVRRIQKDLNIKLSIRDFDSVLLNWRT